MATYRDLPGELKLIIVEYCVVYDHPINLVRHEEYLFTLIKLASLDRSFYTAIQRVYYSENEFLLEPCGQLHDERYAVNIPFKFPPPAVARWIRRLRVHCNVREMSIWMPGSESLTGVNVSELTFLAGRKARWQRHFAPSELRINLRVGNLDDLCYRRHGRASREHQNGVLAWRYFDHLLGNASVHMKAPSVTVKVIHHQINRIPPYPKYPPCGPCAGAFERIVEDWFRKD
jgi:hypothetical protein